MNEMKLFLLSLDEADNLTEEQSVARYNGKPCWWWLRTPGYANCAAYAYSSDYVFDDSDDVYCNYAAVRPAFQIKSSVCSELPKTEEGHFLFGKKPKSGETIEWLFIKNVDGVSTLLSKDCLTFHCYNNNAEKGNDFVTSDLAEFMNTKLISMLFSEEEQGMILSWTNESNENHYDIHTEDTNSITLEDVEKLYLFLQGNRPKGYYFEHLPKLSEEEAFSVIYYLQEEMKLIPDIYERCGKCGRLYDSDEEGTFDPSSKKNLCDDCLA